MLGYKVQMTSGRSKINITGAGRQRIGSEVSEFYLFPCFRTFNPVPSADQLDSQPQILLCNNENA